MKSTKFFHQKDYDKTKDDWKVVLIAGISFFAILFACVAVLIYLNIKA